MVMKTINFQNFLLDREDFVSGMSFVLFNTCTDFEQSCLNTKNLILLQENIYLPSVRFCTEIPYSKCF